VKQEFALVHASILAADLDTEFLQVLCDLKYEFCVWLKLVLTKICYSFDSVPMESFLMHQILVFCKRSTLDDWQLREDFLENYLSKTQKIGNLISALRTFSTFTGDSRYTIDEYFSL
jgi:hypothetical protein